MPVDPDPGPAIKYAKEELRERLDPVAFQVTQEKGTERPYTNKYYKHYESGVYTCVVCQEQMFRSDTKYESGSGWPSFYDIVDKDRVRFRADASGIGGNLLRIVANPHLIRTEVSCKNCGSHLGHIFDDGPLPTGKRYCVNSSSLDFVPSEDGAGDSVDSKPQQILKFPARVNGCGSDGFCTRKSPASSKKLLLGDVQKRIQDKEERIQQEEEEKKVTQVSMSKPNSQDSVKDRIEDAKSEDNDPKEQSV